MAENIAGTPLALRSRLAVRARLEGRLLVLLAAAFGGALPSVRQLAVKLVSPNFQIPNELGYAVGLLLFALMGGITALVWGERNRKRAFFLGLGLPGLILAGSSAPPPASESGKTVGAQEAEAKKQQSAFFLFAAPAYAQDLPADAATGAVPSYPQGVIKREILIEDPTGREMPATVQHRLGRKLALAVEDLPKGTELVFRDDRTGLQERYLLRATGEEEQQLDFDVPDGASYAILRNGTSSSKPLIIDSTAGETTTFDIDVDTPFLKSLLQALGARDVAVYQFDIESRSKQAAPRP